MTTLRTLTILFLFCLSATKVAGQDNSIYQLENRLIKGDKTALSEIANAGFDPVYGARPLKRAIQSEIENPLAREILSGSFVAKDMITVDYKGNKMVFSKV